MEKALTLVKELPGNAWKFFKERWDKIDVFDETKAELQKESPWYQLGGIYYLSWVWVLISGALLIGWYIPTTSQAFDSIQRINDHISFGMIIRGIHKYGGDAMIIAATMRMYRMWFGAEYKNKGEFAFLIALIILLIAMYSGLTGYLLIWNQRAYWATKVFATFPTYLDITPGKWHWPWEFVPHDRTWWLPNSIAAVTLLIGNITHQGMTTSQALLGGSSIGQATMTRFFSLHFGLSLIMLVLTEIYFYTNRLKRINVPRGGVIAISVMLIITAILFPAESGFRADPEVTPLPILSDWYFLALYQMLKYMDPYWATIWTVGIPVMTIGLAFLDWGPERDPWKRPIFTVIGIMGFIQFVVFSLLIIANMANIETDPPYWYAHIIASLTLGLFWHWGLYQQALPMILWAGFNLVASVWYLYLWHVRSGDWLMMWLNQTNMGEWNPANLYWNFLWLAYAILQALVVLILIVQHQRSKRVLIQGAQGASA